jgi:hypothetical protein
MTALAGVLKIVKLYQGQPPPRPCWSVHHHDHSPRHQTPRRRRPQPPRHAGIFPEHPNFILAQVCMERNNRLMQPQGRSLHSGAAFVGIIPSAALYLQMPHADQ